MPSIPKKKKKKSRNYLPLLALAAGSLTGALVVPSVRRTVFTHAKRLLSSLKSPKLPDTQVAPELADIYNLKPETMNFIDNEIRKSLESFVRDYRQKEHMFESEEMVKNIEPTHPYAKIRRYEVFGDIRALDVAMDQLINEFIFPSIKAKIKNYHPQGLPEKFYEDFKLTESGTYTSYLTQLLRKTKRW
ncbi:MAG: hypothetical protein QXQ37_06965 [Nitrososphaerota archaeon]